MHFSVLDTSLHCVSLTGLTKQACEGESFSVSCYGDGEIMVIDNASYGISRSQTECGITDADELCSAPQAKLLVDSRCSGKKSCEFQLLHRKIPNLDCGKNPHNLLKVSYRCVSSEYVGSVLCHGLGEISVFVYRS